MHHIHPTWIHPDVNSHVLSEILPEKAAEMYSLIPISKNMTFISFSTNRCHVYSFTY